MTITSNKFDVLLSVYIRVIIQLKLADEFVIHIRLNGISNQMMKCFDFELPKFGPRSPDFFFIY